MNETMNASIVVESIDSIRILSLNRPPSNALNLALLEELHLKIQEAGQDPGVRCLILSSKIPKYFSSGLDVDELFSLPEKDRENLFFRMFEVHRSLRSFPKPSIASISGSAILGGWIVAMGADFRFLSQETGKVALSEIRLGLSPTPALVSALTAMSGNQSLVKEMILLGRTLRAEEALQGGFADKVFPSAELMEKTLREAKKLCEMPAQAYAAVKKSYRQALGALTPEMEEESLREFRELFNSPEAQQRFRAILARKEKA